MIGMHAKFAANKDLYALLGVKMNASLNEIRAAYRRAALVAHPDKGGTSEAFRAINVALEVLSCSTTRHLYNRSYSRLLSLRRRRLTAIGKATRSTNQCNPGPISAANISKRHSDSIESLLPPRKRLCTRKQSNTSRTKPCTLNLPKQAQATGIATEEALGLMRSLLGSMTAGERSAAIGSVAPEVRTALLKYMQTAISAQQIDSDSFKDPKQALAYKKLRKRDPLGGQSGIRVTQSSQGTRYRAHLAIKGLRFYTNTPSHAAAIENHMILLQMRNALAAESKKDPDAWTNSDKILAVMHSVIDGNNSSAAMLGLHVFVYMRGTPWLDKNTYIISPTMNIDQVVPLYVCLLRAQCTSWEALREEWIQLLQFKKRPTGLSPTEAEKTVDLARQKALRVRLRQAETLTVRAMKREEQITKRAQAAAYLQQRRLAAADARAKAQERRVAWERVRMWKARRQRPCRDMTMEDIMSGNASHP